MDIFEVSHGTATFRNHGSNLHYTKFCNSNTKYYVKKKHKTKKSFYLVFVLKDGVSLNFLFIGPKKPNQYHHLLLVVSCSCKSDYRKKKPVRSCDGFVGREVDRLFSQTLLSTLQNYKATSEEFTTAFDFPDCWTSLKGGSDSHFLK